MKKKNNNNVNIIGVIGYPLKHSLSPLMHNTAFALSKMNYNYIPFEVPGSFLKDAVRGMVALNIKGFNVTLPHKEKICEHLNILSEEAIIIGAVNTVVNDAGQLTGYNTDVNGIIKSLEPYKKQLSGSVATIIGAGGAARSAIYALITYFKVQKINIINRTFQRADSLKEYFTSRLLFNSIKTYELMPPDNLETIRNSKLVINTTSAGMMPDVDDSPIPNSEPFVKDQIVFDTVYNPLKTKFLKLAQSKDAITIDGLLMFVQQGAKSFELWTSQKMRTKRIYSILKKSITDEV
ncbi:MAG: shikimate dehydrogenase [Ignavibacteriales bacterium]|nr:shikimate dehydrogenase [Ignavibacteriales bacterium]